MNWHLGTVGFGYKQWQGIFYPAGLSSKRQLSHYSQQFNSVEIDTTFYGPPRPTTLANWSAQTPADFTFCPKTPRQISHDLRLQMGAVEQMAQFITVLRALGPKLGPILIQLPPDFTAAEQNSLTTFCQTLPTDLRFAIEFRHRSWATPAAAALLRKYNIAYVSTDYTIMPKTVTHTADFLYIRFLGRHGQYVTKDRELRDPTADLRHWQQAIEPHLKQVQQAFGYFNNDYAGYSPKSCNRFKEIMGLRTTSNQILQQGRLF